MRGFKFWLKNNLLRAINHLLRPFSVKLMGRGDPNRDFEGFLGHVGSLGLEVRTVIDVGVAYGTDALYRKLRGAKFFLIEPAPSALPHLAQIASRVNAEIHNVAAGSYDGIVNFNLHDDLSGSSVLKQIEGPGLDGANIPVPVRRLDSLIPAGFARPALLKIDTQGYELEVLAGAAALLRNIDIAIIECSFHAFRAGAPEIGEIIQKMAEFDFVPYETLEGHYRVVDNALAQIDLVFVGRSSRFRVQQGMFSSEQLIKYVKK